MKLRFVLCAASAIACSTPDGPDMTATPPPPPPPANALQVVGNAPVPERYTAEVAAVPGWAYTGAWGIRITAPANIVKVWDVRAATPSLADSLIIEGVHGTVDLHVSDDDRLLLVATGSEFGSAVVYDLADPERPRLLSRFQSPSTRADVHTAKFGRVNGRLYAFLSNTVDGTLVTVDMDDPMQPREVHVVRLGDPFVHDVFVRDGILFAAEWNDGVGIYDLGGGGRGGAPDAPQPIGRLLPAAFGAHNVWWFHNPANGEKRYAFVGHEHFRGAGRPADGDIHIYDVADLANPVHVAMYSPPIGGAHNFWLDEPNGYLYAAFYNGGIRVLDVRGDLGACPASQRTEGVCNLALMGRDVANGVTEREPFVWGAIKVRDWLYASDMLHGLWVLETLRR